MGSDVWRRAAVLVRLIHPEVCFFGLWAVAAKEAQAERSSRAKAPPTHTYLACLLRPPSEGKFSCCSMGVRRKEAPFFLIARADSSVLRKLFLLRSHWRRERRDHRHRHGRCEGMNESALAAFASCRFRPDFTDFSMPKKKE